MNLMKPSTDFGAVRDGRDTKPFYIDIALDSARSDAAGTAEVIAIAGNSVYIDANPSDGNAMIEFQDSSGDITGVPFYVSPGFIARIGFTRVRVTNTAQAGKKIRFIYSTDTDFQPGSVAQVAVSNNGGFTSLRPEQSTAVYKNSAIIGANNPEQVFSAATNINGAVVQTASINIYSAAAFALAGFIAKAAVPANVDDGDPVLYVGNTSNTSGGSNITRGDLKSAVYVPAGVGLYFISDTSTTTAGATSARHCRYKLL